MTTGSATNHQQGKLISKSAKIPARISNQYLLRLLAMIAQLGRTAVSTQLLVEAWQARQLQVDETFFLHFDVLTEYGFVELTGNTAPVKNVAEFLSRPDALEQQVSITLAGSDFFERYHRF